ncbi:MAG: diaminopimelate epimerase [Candidatus Altarchaeaceae archaeon]
MKIPFVKLQAAGNDFVLIDEYEKILVPEDKKQDFVAKISDRHFGIGCDGVIFLQKSDKADAKFHFFNSDGSIAEMCGNGIRCFALYFYNIQKKKKIKKEKFKFETLAGIKEVEILRKKGIKFRVNMGRIYEFNEMNACGIDGFYVNIGNPHFITEWKNIEIINVKDLGRAIRYCTQFKDGVNVHFIQKIKNNEYKIRSYERGVEDETLACGTGICSSAYVMFKKFNERKFLFHARGGDIIVEINDDEEIFMTGDAKIVFEGKIKI